MTSSPTRSSHLIISITIFLKFITQVVSTGSDAVNINIIPDKTIATFENAVHISCVLDSDGAVKTNVTMLEISRSNGQRMAAIHSCSNIPFGSDVSDRIQVSGHIDEDTRKSYLNMTLISPLSQDTDTYTCSMFYQEQDKIKENKKQRKLLVQSLDTSSLEMALYSLKARMAVMEQESREKSATCESVKPLESPLNNTKEETSCIENNGTKVNAALKSMEDRLTGMVEDSKKDVLAKMTNLENNVFYISAFSVSNPSNIIVPKKGKPLVFPEVLMNMGPGYSTSTGIFTAPRNGLYYFNLVITTGLESLIDFDLKANERILARMFATGTTSEGDQTSISTVTPLYLGDVVRVIPGKVKNGSHIAYKHLSLFTGYLLQPMN